MERLRDPAYRAQLDESAQSEKSGLIRALAVWGNLTVDQTFSRANESYLGRRVGDIAQELGKSDFDTMIDIALEDGLRTSYMPPKFGDDEASWALRAKVWQDDRAVIGASDAGAHLDMIDTFAFSTQVLGNGVRKRQLLDLEEAIRQLTDVPAKLYGLKERGQLRVRWYADVVVFDPNTIECGETYTRFDLPADAGRLYADAIGIDHVLVNGVEIVRGQSFTGKTPGTILRAGRDTGGVSIPGA
jgi:N-acyl-D-aspartate/D-glutamate deacylase